MVRIRDSLGLNGLCVNANGRSGWLALFWNKELDVSLICMCRNYIDVIIDDGSGIGKWRFTGVYGEPRVGDRADFWERFKRLGTQSKYPWLCGGDFNEILWVSEFLSRCNRSEGQMRGFREALDTCALIDQGFRGFKYTWCNEREDPHTCRARLDRYVANREWETMFCSRRVDHLDHYRSDHCPIIMVCNNDDKKVETSQRQKPIRFEAKWLLQAECAEVTKGLWDEFKGQPVQISVFNQLRGCRRGLWKWSHKIPKGGEVEISKLKDAISKLRKETITPDRKNEIGLLTEKLEGLLEEEDAKWKQRAKAHWYKHGDKNTAFFHQKANSRKKKNTIKGLEDENGIWCENKEEVEGIITRFYSNLFKSSEPALENMNFVLERVKGKVSTQMNDWLSQPYTEKEVKEALSCMGPLKSPGPDGIPPIFFQKFWGFIGKDVTESVLNFLNFGVLLDKFNFTHIALIPKCKNPVKMSQFRPISLSNVIYKLGAKVLANRLKIILPQVISDTQSAFIGDRLITDNIIIAYELCHFMKCKTQGKEEYMSIKLDVSKAFDRVEWSFLSKCLLNMGFVESFVDRIMMCVTSVTYSFLLNGIQMGYVTPERGIRQGDPLSPYLFVICAEAFSSLLQDAGSSGLISGICLREGAPRINHLLFADDTIVFAKATREEAAMVVQICDIYEAVSGQKINMEKSEVNFSRNTKAETRKAVKDILKMSEVEKHQKYLGLPTALGRNKDELFDSIKERVWSKIAGWRGKNLSKAGREVLIKAVAQAIPVYTMSCFKITTTVLHEIEQWLCNYWWGDDDKGKKIHWSDWKKLCKRKAEGGIGFRDLCAFNQAMLGKQAWKLLKAPDSLMARVMKAKYYPTSTFMGARMGNRHSFTWRSILGSREKALVGRRWRVGNGLKVNVWTDEWIPRPMGFKILTPKPLGCAITMVHELINKEDQQWDLSIITNLFWKEDAEAIMQIPLGSDSNEDLEVWHYNKSGEYTVRSAYHAIMAKEEMEESKNLRGQQSEVFKTKWTQIWGANMPNKIKIGVWLMAQNQVPTTHNLIKRGVQVDDFCDLCKTVGQTITHVLFKCEFARQTWALSDLWRYISKAMKGEESTWICESLQLAGKTDSANVATIMWAIWWNRNEVTMNEGGLDPLSLVRFAKKLLLDFQEANQGNSVARLGNPPAIWKPPEKDFIKVNYDGAVFQEQGMLGCGVILRNSEEKCVGAMSRKVKGPLKAEIAEVVAAKEAVMMALKAGLRRCIFEGDSSVIVNRIRGSCMDSSVLGPFVDDIRKLIGTSKDFSWVFAYRGANQVAHLLARYSKNCNDVCYWWNEPPSFVLSAINADVMKE